jgi:uncharacterized protein YjbI with pentapeptide repeats
MRWAGSVSCKASQEEQNFIQRGLARLGNHEEQSTHGQELSIPARVLARARTLTVLPRLDGKRKGIVLQFLYEANLISYSKKDAQPAIGFETTEDAVREEQGIINLARADLTEGDLEGAFLFNAALSHSDLRCANLKKAELRGADLRYCDLRGADLNDARLSTGQLLLGLALFSDFIGDLSGSRNPPGYTTLGEVSEPAAKLDGADLRDVKGVTTEDLLRQARQEGGISLTGAIMPDGKTYEDCLRDRESRGEAGEIGGPS